MALLLVPIILGGLLCVSKIFILGGLPLILWQVWRGRRAGKVTIVFVSGAALLGLVQSGVAAQWTGIDFLGRLLQPGSRDLTSFYTAGRLGTGSTLTRVIDEVTRVNPLYGVGAGGLKVPYDNGWIEAFVMAGTLGVACYTLTLLAIFRMARSDADSARRRFLTSVVVLAIGGSLGLPALTANRAGSLLWLFLALGALAHQRKPAGARPAWTGTTPATMDAVPEASVSS